MNYLIIIYFLTIFTRITITWEYNDDDEDEKQVPSQSRKYIPYYFMFNCFINPFSSYQCCQVKCFQ
jgi:hypothetical protein